jgi:hypothetical protein
MNASRARWRLIAPRMMLAGLMVSASVGQVHAQTQATAPPSAPAPAAPAPAAQQPGAAAQPESGQWLSRTVDGIMGTRIFVEIWAEDAGCGRAAIDAVMDEMRHIDETMSVYKPTSEVSKGQRALAATQPVQGSAGSCSGC